MAQKSHIAVVAEGGGQRGIYTAGVLDAFQLRQFNPFSLGLGVSAGAQNLFAYFLGEAGYAKRAISDLTAAADFFVPYRWLGSRGVLDLDNYFERTVIDDEYRLPYQRINAVQKIRRLLFVATNRCSMQPMYFEPDASNVFDCLKASSAIPFLYKARVMIDGQEYVDGGIGDPLPVAKAIEYGTSLVVVIRTVPEELAQSSWRQRIDALPLRRALPSQLASMLDAHEQAYADSIECMRNPPAGVEIITIAPTASLNSHAFGSSSDSIQQDYRMGLVDGQDAIGNINKALTQRRELNRRTLRPSELPV